MGKQPTPLYTELLELRTDLLGVAIHQSHITASPFRREQAVSALEMLSSLHSRRNSTLLNGKASGATAIENRSSLGRKTSDDVARYSKSQ